MLATVKTMESQVTESGFTYAVMVDGKIYRKYASYNIAKMVQHVYNDAVHATGNSQSPTLNLSGCNPAYL